MAQNTNPALPAGLRLFSLLVIVVLLLGAGLFFIPAVAKVRWPWALAPFNARFLGSFYLAEMVAIGALLVWNRWSPARLILVMAFVFTLMVTAMSALHLDQFNFGRKAPWLWFVVYIGSAVITGLALWSGRDNPPVTPALPERSPWAGYFRVEAVAFILYGLALVFLPGAAAGFWPWATDVFHAQVYSAIFVAGGIGTWVLAGHAPREELITLGATQLALGLLAIVGLVVTDAAVHRVDWAAAGVYAWLLLFAAIAITGLNKLRLGLAVPRQA